VPFLVRLRPNAAYLALIAAGIPMIIYGIASDGVLRLVLLVSGVLFVVLIGGPVLVSTVGRVPVLAVNGAGVRLPLMGVRLAWPEIAAVRQASGPTRPALLIIPNDTAAALSRMRPWLRAEGRSNLARYGTPIVVPQQSMDHTLDQMCAAFARLRPAPSSGVSLQTDSRGPNGGDRAIL
jgi:hypothetical protein